MKNWKSLLAFIVIGIISLILGQWAFSPFQAVTFVKYGGYWIMLVTAGLFGYFLFKCLLPYIKDRHFRSKAFWTEPKNLLICLLLIFCFLYIRLQEKTEYKIVMDEPVLVATSMSMHEDRLVQAPNRAHTIAGTFYILDGFVDKRPSAYPFFLSVIHDFSGFRPENAFYFNLFLTGLFLFLTYLLGYKLASRTGGVFAVLLFTFLPLFVRSSSGAGFEIFNIVMILVTMLVAIEYLKNPSKPNLSALCLTAVILAQVRYESIMYIAPVGLVILYSWWRERKITVSWGMMITPILLIPYLWTHKVFDLNEGHWQLWDRSTATSPFGLQYAYKNIGHALNFFFDAGLEMTNSLPIAVLALAFTPFFILAVYKMLRGGKRFTISLTVLCFFCVGFVMNTLLIIFYFFGQLDDPIIHRLAFPMLIPMVFIPIWMIYAYTQNPAYRQAFSWFICLGIVVFCVPKIAAKHYSQNQLPVDRVNWMIDIIKNSELTGKHYFVLSETPFIWIMHRVDAMSTAYALKRKDKLLHYLQQKGNPPVYVQQSRMLNAVTGKYRYDGGFLKAKNTYDLDNDFVLEPYKDDHIWPLRQIRFYKLVDIKNTDPLDLPPPKDNKEYMRQWIETLP